MKCPKPKQVFWKDDLTQYEDWITEIKYDGERNLLIIKDGKVKIQRHEGRDKTLFFPEIVDYVKSTDLIKRNVTLDGEICVLVNTMKADFPSIANRQTDNPEKQKTLLKTKPCTFVAFDIVEFDGYDVTDDIFAQRRDLLEAQDLSTIEDFKKNNVVIVEQSHTWSNAISSDDERQMNKGWMEKIIKQHDLEGIVMKNPSKICQAIKLKNYDEEEFEIRGTNVTPTGIKNGNWISALELKNRDGRYVGDCTYNNYPNTLEYRNTVIGKKVLVRYMKTDSYRQGIGKLRFPVMLKIQENWSDA